MGSYYIPNNKLKGESRILYIFTVKSLLFTAAGVFIGLLFYLIFSLIGLKAIGIVIMALLGLIGYGIATIKMPTGGNSNISKNVGGDSVDDIIIRYINFNKNKRVYTYSVPRKNPDYTGAGQITLDNILKKITSQGTSKSNDNTKEEK